jgi:hypothetical protein
MTFVFPELVELFVMASSVQNWAKSGAAPVGLYGFSPNSSAAASAEPTRQTGRVKISESRLFNQLTRCAFPLALGSSKGLVFRP